jgi:hypothetical protein
MSARDDYPLLAARETVIRFGMEQTAEQLTRALDEIDRLRAECAAWMNGVADAVEPIGYNREAACGPSDLLPGLQDLTRSPYHERKTFDRFKYAEELVHYTLDQQDVTEWRISRDPDETYEEDGETYTRPVYVVEWTR